MTSVPLASMGMPPPGPPRTAKPAPVPSHTLKTSGCLHWVGDAGLGVPGKGCVLTLLCPCRFSRTCESLGGGGYRCTACEPGYTGQYCER